MFDRVSRSWELTKQSWNVLRSDKHLVIFPILSSIACLVVLASFAVPIFLTIDWTVVADTKNTSGSPVHPAYYAVIFLFYFVNYFVIAFFNAALIACAINRFNGQDTSLGAGLSAAASRLPQLFAWSLVNATVGMVLRMISERAGVVGRIIIGLLGMAWTVVTFFVVPVLVVEGVGPFAAIKRSTETLKRVWGESLIANIGIGAVTTLIGFVVFLVPTAIGVALAAAIKEPWPIFVGVAIAFVLVIGVSLISSTLNMIVTAACYRFAATGQVPSQFEGDTLRGMFKVKGT